MNKKEFISVGLMSGTSMDGVDLSIIKSDGNEDYTSILNEYFPYDDLLHQELTNLRDKIHNLSDLKKYEKNLKDLERKITIFSSKITNKVLKNRAHNIDVIGFHGQTIYHNAIQKISKQLGDGYLLSQLTKKEVIYNFRKKDLNNGGQGAPLTPIFHKILKKKFNLSQAIFINIGGILNSTTIKKDGSLIASDHGPGMCLLDEWIRKKTNIRYDKDGKIASTGKINKIIVDQTFENFFDQEFKIKKTDKIPQSFDIKDFNSSFIKGLSLEDGAATLVELTAKIIDDFIKKNPDLKISGKIYLCGGGRKNNFLLKRLKKNEKDIKLIDELGVNGDFIESQAFAYLAIRSLLGLPISFPETTGCKNPTTGGVKVKNY